LSDNFTILPIHVGLAQMKTFRGSMLWKQTYGLMWCDAYLHELPERAAGYDLPCFYYSTFYILGPL